MSTQRHDRDRQLLRIGQQCSAPSCFLVDFLPFKCQHCSHAFCGEHFHPEAHKCDKFDASKHNRVAPSCPLCKTPIAIPPGEDPNIRMERHIATQCSVMTGKSGKTSTTPTCARAKCGKVLFAPIRCDKCKQQYCPLHRFPADHACGKSVTSAPNTSSAAKTAQDVVTQTAAASAAVMAALKRAAVSMNTASSSSQMSSTASSMHAAPPVHASKASASTPNLFSKTDSSFSALPSPSVTTTVPPFDIEPPHRCSPKLTHRTVNSFDPKSFIPAPIFATASG